MLLAWSDPQRSMPSNAPPTSHGGNFYGGQAQNSGTPTDWSRISFSGSGFSGGNTPQIPGSFEGANGGVQPPTSSAPGQVALGFVGCIIICVFQEGAAGSTNEIADKLRVAAAKGWIDPVVFCSNNKLSNQTASLLNTLINRLTVYEQNTQKIDQLKVLVLKCSKTFYSFVCRDKRQAALAPPTAVHNVLNSIV